MFQMKNIIVALGVISAVAASIAADNVLQAIELVSGIATLVFLALLAALMCPSRPAVVKAAAFDPNARPADLDERRVDPVKYNLLVARARARAQVRARAARS